MSDQASCASPLFFPLRRWLDLLPSAPDTAAVAELAERFPVLVDGCSHPVRFVPPPADGAVYECRIWETGQVATRVNHWHDFFNALVWLTFPKTKNAVSASHVRSMTPVGEVRGTMRDALTHFDECGIVVLSSQPALLEMLRQFAWKTLFVEHRADVQKHMRFVVFGHATYEQLLNPFRGLTAKAVLYEVSEDWLQYSPEALVAAVDTRLAVDLASGRYTRPRDFQPLPLLGIPGVTVESDDPAYYDDTWQFRPGRQRSVSVEPAI